MTQQHKLTLPEALVFVERRLRDVIKADLPPLQPAVIQLLKRDGTVVSADGMETEVAVFGILVMALCFSDKCNGLVLTLTQPEAHRFFHGRLFSKETGSPTAAELAVLCGKRLIPSESLTDEKAIASALTDRDALPVLDDPAFRRIRHLPLIVPGWREKLSWWQRKFGSPVPPHTPVGEGLVSLNCVVKLANGSVSTDEGVGLLPISDWGVHARHGLWGWPKSA